MDVPHEQPALSSSKSNRFTSQRQTTGVGTTTVERLEPRLSPASRHITEAKAFGTECHVSSFTREQDPDRAVRVEQIHGEAYVAAGHVYESALDELGRLDNSNAEFILDKARGSTRETEVIYLHAVPAEPLSGSQGEGGLRIVGISAVGSIDDLSAFKAAKPSMGLAHQRKLYDAIEDLGHGGVKEIAALSVTADAPPTVSYSLIREVLRLYHRTGEKLIITFAMPAYAKMVMNFGRFAMPQVGEPFYAHRNNDPRTSNALVCRVAGVGRRVHRLRLGRRRRAGFGCHRRRGSRRHRRCRGYRRCHLFTHSADSTGMAFTAEPPVPANPRSPTEAGHQPALSRSARSAGAQTAVTAGHADSAVPANRPDDVPASPGTTDCVCAAGPSPIAGCATDPSTTATRVRDTGGTCCAAAVRSRNAAAVRGASHSGVTVGAAELAGPMLLADLTVADRSAVPALSASLADTAKPAGTARLPGARPPSAILGEFADHALRFLQRQGVGGLSHGIRRRALLQDLYKPVVKQRRLSANGLIGLRPRAKQRRDASRHVIAAGSQHSCRRGGRSGVGRAHSGADRG